MDHNQNTSRLGQGLCTTDDHSTQRSVVIKIKPLSSNSFQFNRQRERRNSNKEKNMSRQRQVKPHLHTTTSLHLHHPSLSTVMRRAQKVENSSSSARPFLYHGFSSSSQIKVSLNSLMDDGGHRENGRLKAEQQHKAAQGQWLMQHQPHQPYMKQIMAIMAERDAAIQERNLAFSEKKTAFAERDMAFLQRDAAIAERNNAIMERDNAIATLQYRDNSSLTSGNVSSCPPGCQISRGIKHMHNPQQHVHHLPHMNEGSYSTREMHTNDSLPLPPDTSTAPKSRQTKRPKQPKTMPPNKKTSKSPRKVKRESEDLNKMTFDRLHEWKGGQEICGGADDLNKQLVVSKSDWKCQDLGLNQVAYDDSTMPAPVCSCTGVMRQCYKWGNGGWQSSCCTTTMSIYPLPAVPNKRHARVGGRKMSGSAFNKLLSRLAAEGHDLSNPVDLKDNWAKHGTNRYITIK